MTKLILLPYLAQRDKLGKGSKTPVTKTKTKGRGGGVSPLSDFGLFSVYFSCWDAKTMHNCLDKIMEICPQSKSTEKYLWINITKGFTTFPKGPQHQGQMAGGERVNGKHMLCFCLYKVFAFCLYKCIVQGYYWHRGTTLPMQC